MELVLALLIGSLGLGLEIEAPRGCITAVELEAAVEQEIGPFQANVQIRMAQLGDRWRARLWGPLGPRTIEERNAGCRALDRALILMIALMAEAPEATIATATNAAQRPVVEDPPPLEKEVSLLLAAFRRRILDPEESRALLELHERRYPRGKLQKERELLKRSLPTAASSSFPNP